MSSREMRSGKREREKEKEWEERTKEKERHRKTEEEKHRETSPRPKRLSVHKALGYNHGLLWKEETDLKKALYMSLQESKKNSMGISQEEITHSANSKDRLGNSVSNKKKLKSSDQSENENQELSLKKTKVHAQRKFAQGSHPNSPVTTPVKFKSTTTNLIPSKRPKTEDFLTFLCLRGTTALPPSLDFFNFASRSNVQAVSDSRCQTPVTPELSNQSSPFTRDHSSRASPVTSEHSNGILNPLPEKYAKKSSEFKQVDLEIKEKKETKKYENRDNVDSKKREKSEDSKKHEHSVNQVLIKPEKDTQEGLKRLEFRDRSEIKKKSERKESLEGKLVVEENRKSPKKKKMDHRETRSEKHQQENKDSSEKKSKDIIKKHLNHEFLKKDIKKEVNDTTKKIESKEKDIFKKHDHKEKRALVKDIIKKIDGKDMSKKAEKDSAKVKDAKHSIKKLYYKEILKKMNQLKSKTRAGQKRERKELLEKQERLKKKKEEKYKEKKDAQEKSKEKKEAAEKLKIKDKVKETKIMQEKLKEKKETQEKLKEKKETQEKLKEKKDTQEKLKEKKETQEKLKDKKENHEKLKDKKETQEKFKEKKETQEKLKEKKETQEKLKEKKETQEKLKDKKETQEKLKEKKEMQEKLKEKKETQEKLKEKKETQEKSKEKKEMQEKSKEKKETQEKLKEKKIIQEKSKEKKEVHEKLKEKNVEKVKEKKDLSEKVKKDLGDKKDLQEKNKLSIHIDKRESHDRVKGVSSSEKKDLAEKLKGSSHAEKKDLEKKNVLPEKKEQTKIISLTETKEVLEKTRSASQIEKKEQERGKSAPVTEKKELDRSKNALQVEKEVQDKVKAASQMERKDISEKNKSLAQGDVLIFKNEARDRSMDPIVVVKARDTVGHRLDGGNKSQISGIGITAPVAVHVTSHRESARILESLPHLPITTTPPKSLSPVPPPITTCNKLKSQSSPISAQIKKTPKLSAKKSTSVLTSAGKVTDGECATEKIDKVETKQRSMRKRRLSDSSEDKPAKKKIPSKILPIYAQPSSSSTPVPLQVPFTPKDFETSLTLKSQEPITPIKTPLKPPRHSKASFTTSPLRMPLPGSPDVSPPSKRRGRPPGVGKRNSFNPSQMHLEPFPDVDATAKMVDAPIYHPSEEEFNDPLIYIEKIRGEAEKYGICCIVPPPSWKPECTVSDDMRINSSVQYVHKMLYRWGPNVQQVECMKKHLETQGVILGQAPLIGGIELDLCKLYQSIHHFGGMQQVNDKKKWNRVADALRIPKASHDRVSKLYNAYCKYLVSYDTLSKEDQQKLDQQVTAERQKKRYRSSDPNLNCVVRGRTLSLSGFYRVARNVMAMWFKQDPTHQEAEHEFWRVVTERLLHTAVHSGNLDTKVCGSGFPSHKASPFAKHGWNLNVSSHNSGNTLRSLGSLSSVTVPSLHVGMLYTASCWYRDPHYLPRIEYLHTGADKIWYCIPKSHGEVFHQAMKTAVPEYCVKTPIWLPADTIMVPPFMLVANGVSLCRLIQQAGQFVVVFSQAYSASICCGYNISESISYARPDWLNMCPLAYKNLKESCEPSLFSLERLLLAVADDHRTHVDTLQIILPMLEEIRDVELKLRKQLLDIGLKTSERIYKPEEGESKSRRIRVHEDEEEGECEVCHCCCYLSMVVNELEESVYCLQHAINLLQKRKNFKNWKLLYRLDQAELNEVLQYISGRMSSAAASPKKKLIPKSPKT